MRTLILASLLGICSGCGQPAQFPPPPPATPAPVNWEYLSVQYSWVKRPYSDWGTHRGGHYDVDGKPVDYFGHLLSVLGSSGWEMTAGPAGEPDEIFFKRPAGRPETKLKYHSQHDPPE